MSPLLVFWTAAMQRDISAVKGIGEAKAEVLRSGGIITVRDLLYNVPRRYIDRTVASDPENTPSLMTAMEGQYITLIVKIKSRFLAHGRKTRLMVQAATLRGEPVSLVWFHGVHYFIKRFNPGSTAVVSGRLEVYSGFQILHPDFEIIDDEETGPDAVNFGRIVPVYGTSEAMKKKGLDSRGLRKIIYKIINDKTLNIPETIPSHLIKKYGFPSRESALRTLHFPDSMEDLSSPRQRMKYEELYELAEAMMQRRNHRKKIRRELWPLPSDKCTLCDHLLNKLPFSLTEDQKNALKTIMNHFSKEHPESVLLQGDVGSGKTLTALLAALHYISNGIQVAVLAPTEVLARQHFRTITDFIGLHHEFRMDFLGGSVSAKSKSEILQNLESGQTDLITGTHALLEPNVKFKDLGLVIIDEQHRFGVEQMETLRSKGRSPDVLAMTATPIPRSLCLTEYADLHIALIKSKPAGRKPIKTMWLKEERRSGLYKSIRNHVSSGRQCYIVYPLIEESEKLDIKAATDAFEELRKDQFPEFRTELLHGRMKAKEKESVMNDFRSGKIQILISTTVIEVGVDVPNATIMVIEHADRFGLSQLHQLRGRVGRGSEESFCVLMTGDTVTDDASERLQAMVDSDDGFYLSEIDLKIRGPGELLGNRQHGAADLRFTDLVEDRSLAEKVFEDAAALELDFQ